MCEAEEKNMTSSHFGGGRGHFTGICQRGSCVFPNKSAFKNFGLCTVYISGVFFPRVTNLRKVGKCVAILICDIHFLRFKKHFIENNTKYNFVFNLRSRKKNQKLDHR